jgi:hypothetical protein
MSLVRLALAGIVCALGLTRANLYPQGIAPLPSEDAPPPGQMNGAGVLPDAMTGPVDIYAYVLDPEGGMRTKSATVQVEIRGNWHMIDPADTTGQPIPGEGHLHYRLDDGPVIATTATRLGFHELAPGSHVIRVTLAGHDHAPLGREQLLTITIPDT